MLNWRGVRTDSASPWPLQRAVHPLDLAVSPSGRLGYPHHFESSSDAFDWSSDVQGLSHFTLFIEGGRIHDLPGYGFKTALTEISAF